MQYCVPSYVAAQLNQCNMRNDYVHVDIAPLSTDIYPRLIQNCIQNSNWGIRAPCEKL